MRCIAEPAFTGALTSFRAKVSHSWLDHEIAMVDTETAQRRWLAGGWAEVAQRWTVLYALAQRFAGHFDDFSAATLVDTLAPLQNLSRDDRNALKASLQQFRRRYNRSAPTQSAHPTRWRSPALGEPRPEKPRARREDPRAESEKVLSFEKSSDYSTTAPDSLLPPVSDALYKNAAQSHNFLDAARPN